MKRFFLHTLVAVSPVVLFALAAPAPRALAAPSASACDAVASLKLPDTTITSAKAVAAGEFTPPGAGGRGGRGMADVPAFCQVHGIIAPTAHSQIHFEVWLPAEGWNGKLELVGNGGLAGTIGYAAMGTAVRNGFASASTDTGHTATEPATWLADRDRVIDYSYRGLHLTTVDAKGIVQAYYTAQAKQSYYTGCSTGGKQGLMEAQRFPADFDGILAGDAANFWTHQMASEVWNGVATSTPETNLPKDKLQLLENATVKACDMLDGAADGLVSDPIHCHFDPAKLQCAVGTADQSACLTATQVAAVKKLYGGVTTSKGKSVYPGFYPGGEMGWASNTVINKTTKSGVSSYDFWGNAMFHDPNWAFPKFDFDANIDRADAELGPMMNATDPNLEEFRKLGHKLIYYHGAADPLIPAQNGVDYYESVVKAQKGADKTEAFYRVFLVPGLYHCSGGPGPIAFGTGGQAPAGQRDADHDALQSLERWVEQGKAPASIIGTKYVDGDASKGVAFQRPLCPYPQIAKYKGTGEMKDAASFACVAVK
jgi:feruloyl esterase